MAEIIEIQDLIQREMTRRTARRAANMLLVERQLIVDPLRSQFVLLSIGWQDSRYIHQCLIHIQIQGDKIWIHEDMTDPGIYEALVENGIPASDIVLGYVSELERSGYQMAKAS